MVSIINLIICPRAVSFLPPTNKVWGKVIFSQASVCPQTETPPDRGPHWTETPPGQSLPPPYGKEWAACILLECILITKLLCTSFAYVMGIANVVHNVIYDLFQAIMNDMNDINVTVLTSTVIFSLGANLDLSNCWLLYREIKLNYGTLDPRNG